MKNILFVFTLYGCHNKPRNINGKSYPKFNKRVIPIIWNKNKVSLRGKSTTHGILEEKKQSWRI